MNRSANSETINHKGIVRHSDSKSVKVSITAESACSGCHAEGSCSLYGKEEKIIEIPGSYKLNQGDQITVMMKQSMGFNAVVIAYVFPLVAVVVSLILLVTLKVPELTAGVISVAILIPYYFILYILRNRINKKFSFTIKT